MGKTQQVGRLVLVKLMVASLSIRSLIILVFPVFHNRKNYRSWYEMWTGRSVYGEQNWTIYHRKYSTLSKWQENVSKQAKPRNVATLLNRAKLE